MRCRWVRGGELEVGWEGRLIDWTRRGLGRWFVMYILQAEGCRRRSPKRRKLCIRAETNILRERIVIIIYAH